MTEKDENSLTGAELRHTFCDMCAPGPHCGVCAWVKEGRLLHVEGDPTHPVSRGKLCTKGLAGRAYVYRKDRIMTPLRRVGERGSGVFEPLSWDEALEEIAAGLSGIRDEYGASSVAFFSGYQKWYRPMLQRLAYSFGSVNYGTESSTCFKSTVMSWRVSAGSDALRPDIAHAGVFLGWASNPYHSSYLMAETLERRKRDGMKILIVDPRRTHTAERLADIHLRPRPGTDGALALGIGRELIRRGVTNNDYVNHNVYGFEEYRAYAEQFTPERVEELTGVPAPELIAAVGLIAGNLPLAVGQSGAALVHHTNGLQNHRAVMALSALTGSYDRRGGLLINPLSYADSGGGFYTRDHAFSTATFPQNAPVPVGVEKFPLWWDIIGQMQATELSEQILTGKPYPVRAVLGHGLNYRMFPSSDKMKQALTSLDFFISADLFLTDTCKLADIVLPVCSSFERAEFKVLPGSVQYFAPVIDPLGQSRPDTDIITELARRLCPQDETLCRGYDACLSEILKGLPVDVEELKRHPEAPFPLPDFRPIQPGETGTPTPTGKFELYSTVMERYGYDPLPVYTPPELDPARPFTLSAGVRLPNALHSRCHDIPWLRSLRPEPLADISTEDAERMGIAPGAKIRLSTAAGSLVVGANPTPRMLPGTVGLYHGYREADVNTLFPADWRDPISGFPGYNAIPCRIEKEAET